MAHKKLIKFIETAKCFDNNAKLKLILFAAGIKPNTFIALRVYPFNLEDKEHFERHLKEAGIIFEVSRGKAFEEINKVSKNSVVWKLAGTWYGYDIFKDKKSQQDFHKYVSLVRKQNHPAADRLAGRIYGYPKCCIETFIKEHDHKYIAKKYSYYEFYKRLHYSDKAFPFISHTPCSSKCAASKKLNKRYADAVKKHAPVFWKAYTKERAYKIPLIVDVENDLMSEPLLEGGKTVWPIKDGHDYLFITKKPIEGKHLLISHLTKKAYERGTIVDAIVTRRYDYAEVEIKRVIDVIRDLHHRRKFVVLKR